jgi:sugar phosphate isomerase/epimerase
MNKFIFSGFADEAGVTVERQMDVLEKNGVKMIEMRGVDGGPVIQKSAGELLKLKEKLDIRGFAVSAIGSPVGKSPIEEDFSIAKATFNKAINAAKALDTKYIRAFSFYIPKGGDPMLYAGEAARRVGELIKIAEDNGIVYALENESDIFTDIPSRCAYLMDKINSPYFKMAFDPGNFIMNGAKPYPEAYKLLKNHIAYFHVKDASGALRRFVPSGEGESEMGALLASAFADGFDGVLSVEPHLKYLEGINDAQRFTTAVNALKKTLNEFLGADLPLADLRDFVEYGQE